MIILGFLLVLGAAVLFNFAILGYVRHRAVTGADAAALAGAEEIARYLSTRIKNPRTTSLSSSHVISPRARRGLAQTNA